MSGPVLLVGCGKMGGAMLEGWLARSMLAQGAHLVEPSDAAVAGFRGRSGVTIHRRIEDLPRDLAPEIVVLAVKPQTMDAVLPGLARFRAATFLSIAAGKRIEGLSGALGGAAVVRSMPNTPSAVGRGMTVAVAGPGVSETAKKRCDELLSAVGEVAWVEDEALIDPVTAVSGGGPAYVFLLIEALAAAGEKAGLPADLAMRLARVTVSGSGELARLSPEPAAQLRRNVTSPGGTTLEALKVLMAEDGIQPIFDRAIAEATRRAKELGQ
ncbi:MAG: pyrroline-5-carboxylate reductase [Alphaproteobacteria bacterium]|nr:pyrroline-5-carboxylate reductase [Alphaproteobacteria bacterium]